MKMGNPLTPRNNWKRYIPNDIV